MACYPKDTGVSRKAAHGKNIKLYGYSRKYEAKEIMMYGA